MNRTTTLSSPTEKALYTAILGLIAVFSLLTNTCVVRIIWKNKKLHGLCYYIFISLCVTHMLLLFVNIPFIIKTVFYPLSRVGHHVCQFQAFALSSCMVASICGIAIICCIRWLAITRPYHYRNVLVKKWLIFPVVGLVWLNATLSSLPPVLGWGSYGYYNERHLCLHRWSPMDANLMSYLIFYCLCAFCLPFSCTAYFQFSSLRVARKQTKRQDKMLTKRRIKRNPLKALTASLCVLGLYLFLWLPHGILVSWWDILHPSKTPPPNLENISMVIAMCSSFTTPLCFIMTDRLLKNSVINSIRSFLIKRNFPQAIAN
ncbi:visual pigment-like receptor peropsin [Exaiptasia diaphana]|uniref:G-protein coupled receptors family 1 profile domain-containing protein n=1 Tax=Exaiptasia diaphana TaxID=2652724 RepID=A0A913YAI8_EXADI|nr:visual pigment-like receptor peropsin [Exaiptasia diaphana]